MERNREIFKLKMYCALRSYGTEFVFGQRVGPLFPWKFRNIPLSLIWLDWKAATYLFCSRVLFGFAIFSLAAVFFFLFVWVWLFGVVFFTTPLFICPFSGLI